jgi:hypothetical protein
VYTGCSNSTCSNNTYGVFDSIQYAVDEQIGNIISASYGACETSVSSTNFTALDQVLQQATTQGQTVLAASGDQGSTACSGTTGLTTAQQQALAVNYPASSQYATGVGGTEIAPANDAVGTYWASATSTTVPALSTALQYIPEVAWNDDAVNGTYSPTNGGGLSASGGGVSTFYTSKPSWQKGVTGIPNDNKRDVPDIALYASPNYPGYLYCSSDQSVWSPAGNGSSAQQGSCTNGFLDSTGGYLTIAGGTSFAAPIFAGMLAIINQEAGYTAGQGNVNPSLYTLASNAATYAAAFHDVTSGNNYCTAGTTYGYCSSGGATEGYAAGTGYDLVTGLGSVNLDALAPAWMTNAAPLVGTTTSVSASNSTPNSGQSVTFTISVASNTGSTTPTGNVTLQIDGGTAWGAGGTTVAAQPLSNNGTLTYTTSSFTTAGVHQVLAQYAGDATHTASTGVAQVTIAGTSSGTGSFTLTATAVTVSQGSAGNSTITVKPAGGYNGTVLLAFSTSNDTALANLCYNFANQLSDGDGSVAVTSASAVTTTLTLDTNAADCATAAVSETGTGNMRRLGHARSARNSVPANPSRAPLAVAFAGLLLAGFLGRASRKLRNFAGVIALLAVGLAVSSCGGGGSGGGSGGGGGGGGGTPSAQAQGAYFGTASNGDSFEAIILPNNTLYSLYGTTTGNVFNVMGLITGPGNSSNGSYSASITDYYSSGQTYAGSVSASYVAGSSISGKVNDSGVGTLSFNGTPLPTSEYNYNTQASLSNITGSWSGALFGGVAATVNITSNGTFSGSGQGCSYNGSITADSSVKNFFDFSLTYGGSPCLLPNQTQKGIAVDYLLSDGVTRQLLAAVSSSSSGNVFIANRASTSPSNPPKGTYTITLTGQDSTTASITGSTTFTFIIQ